MGQLSPALPYPTPRALQTPGIWCPLQQGFKLSSAPESSQPLESPLTPLLHQEGVQWAFNLWTMG